MSKFVVLAHSYAATGEPRRTRVVGYCLGLKDGTEVARVDYEKQLDRKSPTSWEDTYSIPGIIDYFNFYNEYKEKYKDWKPPQNSFKGRWME